MKRTDYLKRLMLISALLPALVAGAQTANPPLPAIYPPVPGGSGGKDDPNNYAISVLVAGDVRGPETGPTLGFSGGTWMQHNPNNYPFGGVLSISNDPETVHFRGNLVTERRLAINGDNGIANGGVSDVFDYYDYGYQRIHTRVFIQAPANPGGGVAPDAIYIGTISGASSTLTHRFNVGTLTVDVGDAATHPIFLNNMNIEVAPGIIGFDANPGDIATATFTNGRIYISGTNSGTPAKFVFGAGSASAGGSTASFIDGPTQSLNTTGTFIFPLGDQALYSPVTITPATGYTTAAGTTLQYVVGDGGSALAKETGIAKVSTREYFLVTSDLPTASTVKVRYDNFGGPATPNNYVADPATLVLAGYDGTQWVRLGTGTAAGGVLTTTLTRSLTGISRMTIGSTSTINPLPVNLLSFEAAPNGKAARLSWTFNNANALEGFEVERAADGAHFEKVGTVAWDSKASGSYTFNDNAPATPLSYYRLKMRNTDGSATTSVLRTVRFDGMTGSITVMPNPVSDYAQVRFKGDYGQVHIRLYDTGGKLVATQDATAANGSVHTLDMTGVTPGTYFLSVRSEAGALLHQQTLTRR